MRSGAQCGLPCVEISEIDNTSNGCGSSCSMMKSCLWTAAIAWSDHVADVRFCFSLSLPSSLQAGSAITSAPSCLGSSCFCEPRTNAYTQAPASRSYRPWSCDRSLTNTTINPNLDWNSLLRRRPNVAGQDSPWSSRTTTSSRPRSTPISHSEVSDVSTIVKFRLPRAQLYVHCALSVPTADPCS